MPTERDIIFNLEIKFKTDPQLHFKQMKEKVLEAEKSIRQNLDLALKGIDTRLTSIANQNKKLSAGMQTGFEKSGAKVDALNQKLGLTKTAIEQVTAAEKKRASAGAGAGDGGGFLPGGVNSGQVAGAFALGALATSGIQSDSQLGQAQQFISRLGVGAAAGFSFGGPAGAAAGGLLALVTSTEELAGAFGRATSQLEKSDNSVLARFQDTVEQRKHKSILLDQQRFGSLVRGSGTQGRSPTKSEVSLLGRDSIRRQIQENKLNIKSLSILKPRLETQTGQEQLESLIKKFRLDNSRLKGNLGLSLTTSKAERNIREQRLEGQTFREARQRAEAKKTAARREVEEGLQKVRKESVIQIINDEVRRRKDPAAAGRQDHELELKRQVIEQIKHELNIKIDIDPRELAREIQGEINSELRGIVASVKGEIKQGIQLAQVQLNAQQRLS